MKLYIEEAFAAAKGGDVKGAFEILFQDLGGMIKGPTVFFADLFAYLRKTLGIDAE